MAGSWHNFFSRLRGSRAWRACFQMYHVTFNKHRSSQFCSQSHIKWQRWAQFPWRNCVCAESISAESSPKSLDVSGDIAVVTAARAQQRCARQLEQEGARWQLQGIKPGTACGLLSCLFSLPPVTQIWTPQRQPFLKEKFAVRAFGVTAEKVGMGQEQQS